MATPRRPKRLSPAPTLSYMIAGQEYVTYIEASRRLGVTRERIRRVVADRGLPIHKISARVILVALDALSLAYTPNPARIAQARKAARAH